MNREKKMLPAALVIAAFVFLSAMVFCYFFVTAPSSDVARIEDMLAEAGMIDPAASTKHLPGKSSAGRTMPRDGAETLEDRLAAELKAFYGSTISEKSTQVLLLKIKNFLSGLYPTDGDLRFYAILKRAFPDLADEIMETIEKMEQYNLWLEENGKLLSQMNELEKQGLLWEKRREFFGDEAEIIWSEEVLAYEKRKQEMKDTLRLLDATYDATMDEKLRVYKTSLQHAYEDSPESYILENTDMLAKVFFSIDSVQEDLKTLEPEQRKLEMRRIRKEMGYTRQQIEEMEERDDYRERRWENGLAYMNERDRIVNESEGPQLEARLKELREQYFSHEAKTIELEEQEGFFRYTRQRIYGRN